MKTHPNAVIPSRSHPTRVRGLKPHLVMDAWLKGLRSHPTRVRGLKR